MGGQRSTILLHRRRHCLDEEEQDEDACAAGRGEDEDQSMVEVGGKNGRGTCATEDAVGLEKGKEEPVVFRRGFLRADVRLHGMVDRAPADVDPLASPQERCTHADQGIERDVRDPTQLVGRPAPVDAAGASFVVVDGDQEGKDHEEVRRCADGHGDARAELVDHVRCQEAEHDEEEVEDRQTDVPEIRVGNDGRAQGLDRVEGEEDEEEPDAHDGHVLGVVHGIIRHGGEGCSGL